MPSFKIRVYETLRHLYNKRIDYISTKRLVKEMRVGYYRVYRALKTLERDGAAQRKSRQSGWRPTLLVSAVYGSILTKYRRYRTYIPTNDIAHYINQNPRTVRTMLNILEDANIVYRQGKRSGWKPIRDTPTTAIKKILDTISALYNHNDHFVTTNNIASHLNITPRHTRRLLYHYEQQGSLIRLGKRGGWKPA